MDLNLTGKTVVITGGGTGIGKATAWEFLREGANVCILGRSINHLIEFAKEAEGKGYKLFYKHCDVANRREIEEYALLVYQTFGRLDVWVNNAGIAIDKPFLEFNDDDFKKIVDINLKAVIDGTQIAASYMKKKHNGGVIVNASSFASLIPHVNGVLYGATKAAVSNVTRSTAAALAPYGIRVVGYIPGMIVTPISKNMISLNNEKLLSNISLHRYGQPEDLAKPIVFLCSDAAKYISGCELEVTGGKFAVQDCAMGWDLAEKRKD